MTRIGLIGAGRWGRNAARAMAKAGVLAWVADADSAAANALGAEFCRPSWSVHDDALDDCDAVWICTPIETHELLVHAALSAGKHVLCEKPLARTKAQAEMLADEAKRRGLVLMADHTWLAHHSARTVVDANDITEYLATRHAKDERGFDPIEDLLPHDVVLAMRALRGPLSRVRVVPNGATTDVTMDRKGEARAGTSYSYDSATKVRQMESWTRDAYRVTGGELPANAPEPLSVVLDTFLDAIRTGQPPSIGSADEFIHVAAVIEAAKRSRAAGGVWTDVE